MKSPGILKKVVKILDSGFVKEIKAQGHSLSGALEASINGRVENTEATGTIVDYGNILNAGTSSSRIPFSGISGRGGTSKYIQGLIAFFKLRGLGDKEAKSAAFATAQVQRKEGMSTQASSRFSKTGKRQNFIEVSFEKSEPIIDKIISDGMDEIFNQQFNKQKSEVI